MLIGQEDLVSNDTQTGSRRSSKLQKKSDDRRSELQSSNFNILHPEIKVMSAFKTN
jgi:hypothetical protein